MVKESQYFLVMPCAGSGLRAGGDVAKQYQSLAGLPLVVRSLKNLAHVSKLRHAVLVISPHDQTAHEVMKIHGCAQWFSHFSVLAQGGATRMESVLAGVRSLTDQGAKDHDWVLVHDAARCLVQPQWVEQLIQEVGDDEVGGILAWPVSDTLKQAQALSPTTANIEPHHERIVATVPRQHKWLAQTPQMFRVGALRDALQQVRETLSDTLSGSAPTDEASAMEALGLSPLLVKASAFNIKVTYAEDFLLAKALLSVLQEV